MPNQKPPCPKCKSKNVSTILWGLPVQDGSKKTKTDNVQNFGYNETETVAEWQCNNCGYGWGLPENYELLKKEDKLSNLGTPEFQKLQKEWVEHLVGMDWEDYIKNDENDKSLKHGVKKNSKKDLDKTGKENQDDEIEITKPLARSKNTITLMKINEPEISIHLTAEINPEGELILEGQDLGSNVEEYWGDSDYEYWVTVASENRLDVLVQLLCNAFSNLQELQAWLDSAGIRFTLNSNVIDKGKFNVKTENDQILIFNDPKKEPVFVIEKRDEEKLLLQLLKYMYKRENFKNSSDFIEWLKKNNIKYEFFSYV